MKKCVSILLAAVMCAGMMSPASAAGKLIELTIGSPKMTVDGTETEIDSEGTAPVIVNDRTLMPIRAIIEAVGGTVTWDGEARKVTLLYNGSTIELVIDSVTALINGEENTLDTAPMIIN
ncbi:MAG: copper amine oxidase N-terminal domain-containing protein [Clostridia bacterium]|nr:copper amine oxidase N-terminal domain-containing protein [Clostridia bacterium]